MGKLRNLYRNLHTLKNKVCWELSMKYGKKYSFFKTGWKNKFYWFMYLSLRRL